MPYNDEIPFRFFHKIGLILFTMSVKRLGVSANGDLYSGERMSVINVVLEFEEDMEQLWWHQTLVHYAWSFIEFVTRTNEPIAWMAKIVYAEMKDEYFQAKQIYHHFKIPQTASILVKGKNVIFHPPTNPHARSSTTPPSKKKIGLLESSEMPSHLELCSVAWRIHNLAFPRMRATVQVQTAVSLWLAFFLSISIRITTSETYE